MEETPRTKEQRSREIRLSRACLGALGFWFLLLPCVASQAKEMYLNSLANCGHNDYNSPWHKVDWLSLYRIRDDVSPNTRTSVFIKNCQMVFRSTSSDGRLCVFQHNVDFDNDNMELRLYDGNEGYEGKKPMATQVANRDHDIPGVEWCTTGRFLTIEMVPRDRAASVKDMIIDLMVYHMSSVHRKAYLDTSPSCGSTYKLDHSQVNVTNLNVGYTSSDIHSVCYLDFMYEGLNENRTLCMVFEPAQGGDDGGGGGDGAREKGRCGFNYTVTVETLEKVSSQVLSIESGCENPSAKRWCSNNTKFRLILTRGRHQGFEKDVLFNVLVLDHEGDPTTLPSVFKPSKGEESGAPELFTTIIAVSSVIGLIIIIIAVMVVVLCRRRGLARRTPQKPNGESSSRMLGREARSNGQNHYTRKPTETA